MSTIVSIGEAGEAVRVCVDEVVEKVKSQVNSRVPRAENALRNAALETLRGQGRGRIYKKSGGGTYQASAPGDVPARRSGILGESWIPASQVGSGESITVALQNGAPYAGYLQDGTSKMAARPFKEKIEQAALPEIISIYSEPYV